METSFRWDGPRKEWDSPVPAALSRTRSPDLKVNGARVSLSSNAWVSMRCCTLSLKVNENDKGNDVIESVHTSSSHYYQLEEDTVWMHSVDLEQHVLPFFSWSTKELVWGQYQRSGPLLISYRTITNIRRGRHSHGIELMRRPGHQNLSYHLVFVPYRKTDEVVLTMLRPKCHGCGGIGETHVIDIWSAVCNQSFASAVYP